MKLNKLHKVSLYKGIHALNRHIFKLLKHHVVCHANQYFLFAFMAIVYGLLDIFVYYAIAVLHYATVVLH